MDAELHQMPSLHLLICDFSPLICSSREFPHWTLSDPGVMDLGVALSGPFASVCNFLLCVLPAEFRYFGECSFLNFLEELCQIRIVSS